MTTTKHDPKILDALYSLKQKYADPQDQFKIDGWVKEAQDYLIMDSLRGHKGIEKIISNFEKEVNEMNQVLLNTDSNSLPDKQRDAILNRRNLYQSFMLFFTLADTGLDKIEADIEKEK